MEWGEITGLEWTSGGGDVDRMRTWESGVLEGQG